MFFSKYSEFIEALYNIFFSTLDNKDDLLKQIYNEYIQFGKPNRDFEEIYFSINDTNFHITNANTEFFKKYDGRLLSIKELLNLKIKIHHIHTLPFIKPTLCVTLQNKNFTCQQCKNKNQEKFFTYTYQNKNITYCRNCLDFGKSDSLTYKFHILFPTKENNFPIAKPKVTLSYSQQLASDKLLENIKNNKNSLVWAVCGAGKTEIIYNMIYLALKENKKICLTIPRKDVVDELYSRIKKDFNNIPINILHGDKKDLNSSTLYIMTTHQIVKYFNYFDIVIVDEVDAFPYYGDTLLEQGVLSSIKENGNLIFLSATPSQKIKNYVDDIIKIPIRYHGSLLPIPKIKIDKNLLKNLHSNKNIKLLNEFIEQVISKNRKCLIFVPAVALCDTLENFLKRKYGNVLSVTSVDSDRNNKINLLRNNKINILITTTILERGVTFDYLDVLIFNADHKHFSKEALIQIAGRVGRKSYDTHGEIIFLATEKNKNMKKAIKEINYMNELAKYRKLNKED